MITLQQLQSLFPQQQHQHQTSDGTNTTNVVTSPQIQTSTASTSVQQQTPTHVKTTIFGSPQQAQAQVNQQQNPQPQIINLPHQFIQLKQENMPQQQYIQGGQIIQQPNGMFQVLQPMQTVTVDGQEALFIPNIQNIQNTQNLQPVQLGGQQAYITPNGQIVRAPAGLLPGNFLHNMTQAVQLPNGE